MQRLKSAARQPWGFQCLIQALSGSPKGLAWELRDPRVPMREGQAAQADNSQSVEVSGMEEPVSGRVLRTEMTTRFLS